jgi:hypothetical protein
VRIHLVLCVLLSPSLAAAEPVSLWEAELQLGYGIARRGSAEGMTTAQSPLALTALGAVGISDEPPALAFGGLTVETLERSSVGMIAGARLEPTSLPVRLRAAGIWMFAPLTLWGAQASAGACLGAGTFAVCGDLQLTAYFGGTGLAADETELQVQFALGFVAKGGR